MLQPNRRQLLVGAMFALVEPPLEARAQPPEGTEVEAWMDAWMNEKRATVGTLHLSRFVEPVYFLIKPTAWLPDAGQTRLRPVNVPTGFVTDFASIPRAFWSMLRPDGEYTHPAIVHDYLYWMQTTSREDADEIFRIMMEDFSIPAATAATIHAAVRAFGGTAWDSNVNLKAAGEKRILKRFPDDPRTTWKHWKQRLDVFE
jgi:hypothetical protein